MGHRVMVGCALTVVVTCEDGEEEPASEKPPANDRLATLNPVAPRLRRGLWRRPPTLVSRPSRSCSAAATLEKWVTYGIMCQVGKGYSLWLCNSHEQEHPDATAYCDD